MNLKSLRNKFLSQLPVVGPHADIEAELMLAGLKPITWTVVVPEDKHIEDLRIKIRHEGRKRLDEAVKEGKLIAIDVEQALPQDPGNLTIIRHYAQPENEDKLKRIAAFNTNAFNGEPSSIDLGVDMGYHLGYRKRDILFFNWIINSRLLPDKLKEKIIDINRYSQIALRERLLEQAGHSPDEWYSYVQSLDAN